MSTLRGTYAAVIRLPDGTQASARVATDGWLAFTPIAVNGQRFWKHGQFVVISRFDGASFIVAEEREVR